MHKNIKKVLSYVVAIVLALGIGVTYAYAVGGNDTNNLMTKTEWQQKIDQIRASIDNVTKTINATNMDFVMNGPRLQVSLAEGWQNNGAIIRHDEMFSPTHSDTTSTWDLYPTRNDIFLQDTFDGRQKVKQVAWADNSPTGYSLHGLRERMAFKTNIPDIYLVVSVFSPFAVFLHYVQVGTYPIYNSTSAIPARTLTVQLPRPDWVHYKSVTETITDVSRTNSRVWYGYNLAGNAEYTDSTINASDGFSNTGDAYVRKTVAAASITYTIDFPAGANSIRSRVTNFWDIIPCNMKTRKFATAGDRVVTDLTAKWGASVAKVYSPAKGCLCLKTFVNGEIPIMNE